MGVSRGRSGVRGTRGWQRVGCPELGRCMQGLGGCYGLNCVSPELLCRIPHPHCAYLEMGPLNT